MNQSRNAKIVYWLILISCFVGMIFIKPYSLGPIKTVIADIIEPGRKLAFQIGFEIWKATR